MAIKNRVTSKGFFADKLGSGYDELSIESVQVTQPAMLKTVSASMAVNTTVSISAPFTMIELGTTASLPAIGNHNVGQMFILALTSSGVVTARGLSSILTGAANQLNGRGTNALGLPLSGSCNIVWCIAAKTPSNTFNWIVASGSAL